MLSLINISMRNVSRNVRRSMITAAAVLIGTGFIILARALLNGFHANMIADFTETQAGDIQLHRPDYLEAHEALPLDKSFAITDEFRTMIAEMPEINAFSGRIMFSGMISNGDDTTLFFGLGIDPENEYKVCPKNKIAVMPGGNFVHSAEPNGVVLGKSLAESLKATIGSELTLLVNTRRGNLNGIDVKVVGIAEFLLPGIGNKVVHVPLATAQRLLYMDDQVTEVVINVKDLQRVPSLGKSLEEMLAGKFKHLNLSSSTWMEIGKLYVQAIELQNSVLQYVIVVLFIVMIAGIVNTMLMSVFERVREIGTMMAIGVRRYKILALFMLESVTLALLGAFIGIGGSWLLVQILHRTGAPIPLPGTDGVVQLYPYIGSDYVGIVLGVAILVAVVAALYPAVRASRMKPAEALRTM